MDITLTEEQMTIVEKIGARLLNALTVIPPGKQPPSIIMFAAYVASTLPEELREEMLAEFEKAAEEMGMAAGGGDEVREM